MDDILFLIISLVIAGIGAAGQFKKKKPLLDTSQEEAEGDFFAGFRTEGEYLQEEGVSIYEQDMFSPVKIENTSKKEDDPVIFEEGVSAINNKKENYEILTNTESDYNKLKIWRKAVVYNEILNRKYC